MVRGEVGRCRAESGDMEVGSWNTGAGPDILGNLLHWGKV